MSKSQKFYGILVGFLFIILFSSEFLSGATFIVTNTNDTGPGSLRDAINASNATVGADTVIFNISGTGVQTIYPLSQLPQLTDTSGVFINGLTQSGASTGGNPPSTAILTVEINGSNAGAAHGFWIVSPNNTIQGVVVDSFEQDGIRIQGTPDGTYFNRIYCNFIGTDPGGNVAQGNGQNQSMYWAGVDIIVTPSEMGFAFENFVEANLISGNYAEGVGISNCPPGDVFQNFVTDNYIGTDVTGTIDLGNSHDGVYIGEGAHDNVVDSNLISGNNFEGVCIVGYAELGIYTYANIISNNIIGLDINLSSLPNSMDGISIGQYGNVYQGGYATDNLVAENTLSCNIQNGISIWEFPSNTINADRNQITQNSIYDNGALGIDLGDNNVTINDPRDPDSGPNQEINFPVITGANYSSGLTTITGTIDIDSDPTQSSVEVFKAKADLSNYGEGEIYLNSTTPDSFSNWSIVVTGLNPNDYITATVTDSLHNTSEFCQNFFVVGIEDNFTNKPLKYELYQNSPNPFTFSTTIQYSLPKKTYVSLKIYDISGKLVRILIEGVYNPSYYTVSWDGKDSCGKKVSSGIYFYRLKTEDFDAVKKMLSIK